MSLLAVLCSKPDLNYQSNTTAVKALIAILTLSGYNILIMDGSPVFRSDLHKRQGKSIRAFNGNPDRRISYSKKNTAN